MASASVPGQTAAHPALDWTVFKDGFALAPSSRHGTGVFATRDLRAGELILVEAGLSAPRGNGSLLMHSVFSPPLLASLCPQSAVISEGSEFDVVVDYVRKANVKLNTNDFDINCDELNVGGRAFFTLQAFANATSDAQRAHLRAEIEATAHPPLFKFTSPLSSKFNCAQLEEELNVTYAFAKGTPSCMFFVTRCDVSCGEELLIYYGAGSNAHFSSFHYGGRALIDDLVAAYKIFAKTGPHPVPARIEQYLAVVHHLADALPRSPSAAELEIQFTHAQVLVLMEFVEAYRALTCQLTTSLDAVVSLGVAS